MRTAYMETVAAAGRTVEDDDDNNGRATGDGPNVRGTEPLWREKRPLSWREKPNAVGLGLVHTAPVITAFTLCSIIY